jgi:hypothetical protein
VKTALSWCVAIAAAAALLVAAGYRSRDPDSALYAKLSASLATQPLPRWIAPEWGGEWDHEGLFREHPVGILLPPAALVRAGFPAEQAAYAVNMAYQALAILLIPAVAAFVLKGIEARSLAWLLQLIPVAFVYRIRGNQEHPLLVCFLAMIYATHRSRANPWWIALTIAAFCALVLIKGAFALLALAAAVLWAAIVQPAVDSPRNNTPPWPWIGFALAIAAAGSMMAIYEAVYVRTTGESFLSFYNATRLGASIQLTDARVVPHSLINAGWYAIRLIWFAAPWSLFAACALWAAVRGVPPLDRVSRRALLWTIAIVVVYVAALSPALVRAERFVFPLYFVVGAVGIATAIRHVPAIARLTAVTDRYPSLPIAVWFVTFLLSLASRVMR